ncbi:MAG: alpha/beta hydrolase [Actinomycetota bacterium]|nr:alpha/beta hydrolase [Actinomycetota bacterium]
MSVWHDIHGQGTPVVLLHAGVTDSRLWEPQLRSFAQSHSVLRVDLPGFGNSPIETNLVSNRGVIRDAMDAEGIDRAALVGVSLGGNTALELALESPERVSALVLVGAGLPDHKWSEEVTSFFAAEEEALERRDLDGAVEANLHTWLAGPRRSLDDIDPAMRALVGEMQRHAFEQQKGHDDVRVLHLDPPASERFGEVKVPTLVLTGDEDVTDIHLIADRLAAGIPGAERATIAAAAHLPNLERPEEFDRIVLGFLAKHGV